MKIEIEYLVNEYKKIKHLWFNALRDCDDAKMKLYQKRMTELEAKIRIHTDTMSDEEKQVIAWEVPPSAKWTAFALSHHFHRDL